MAFLNSNILAVCMESGILSFLNVAENKIIHSVNLRDFAPKAPDSLIKFRTLGCACSVSPCGQYLAASAHSREICLFAIDSSNENELKITFQSKYEGHLDEVEDCCFLENTNKFVTCSRDKTVLVWSYDSTKSTHPIASFCCNAATSCLATTIEETTKKPVVCCSAGTQVMKFVIES